MLKKLLTGVAMLVAGVLGSNAQEPLYACGAFNGWDALNPVAFTYSEGLYTLEIDFTDSDLFKISSTKGLTGNGWSEFDEGTLYPTGSLSEGVWTPLQRQSESPNITAPAKEKMTVTVDLDRMLIKMGEGDGPATAWSGTLPVMFINTEGNVPVTEKETYLNATWYIDPMGLPGVEGLGSAQEPLSTQIKGSRQLYLGRLREEAVSPEIH